MITRFNAWCSTEFCHFKLYVQRILSWCVSAKQLNTEQKSMTEVFNILTLIFKHTTCFSIYLIQDAAFFYGKMKLILQWWAACLYYVNCICINAIGWLVLHYRVGILIKTNRFCHMLFTCFSIIIPSRFRCHVKWFYL